MGYTSVGGGGGGSGASYEFIWGDGSYPTWDLLYAALTAISATLPRRVLLTDNLSIPALPASGKYNLQNVTIEAATNLSGLTLTIEDGAQCEEQKAPRQYKNVGIAIQSTSVPWHDQVGETLAEASFENCIISTTGTKALYQLNSASGQLGLTLKGATYGYGGLIFRHATAGGTVQCACYDAADLAAGAVTTVASAEWLQVNYSPLAGTHINPTTQTGMLGDTTISIPSAPGYIQPQMPPQVASALDDQFAGTSINAKWLTFDPGGFLTAAQNNGSLKLTASAQVATSVCGKYQPLSADDEHEFLVQLGTEGVHGNYLFTGLGVMGPNGTPATTVVETVTLVDGDAAGMPLVSQETYTTYLVRGATNPKVSYLGTGRRVFLLGQVKVSTKAIQWWMSGDDGFSWQRVDSITMAVVPTSVLLWVQGWGRQTVSRFRFFRYRSAASGIVGVTPNPTGRTIL